MTILGVIILSIVEGLTEFIPVSSTAHMVFASRVLGMSETANLKTFIIAIQLGAFIAGSIFILQNIKLNKKIFLSALIAFIPTGLIGFFAYPYIKNFLIESIIIMASALFVGGILILLLDGDIERGDKTDLSYKDAFILGIVQTLAFIPGVSRSGALIIGGKLLKYKRTSIVIFTFLLGLPTLAAATAYDLYKSRDILTWTLGVDILLGAVISGIVAYIVCRWLLTYISNHSFKLFGWYRIILGVAILIGIYLI